jgi:hypothetical protein
MKRSDEVLFLIINVLKKLYITMPYKFFIIILLSLLVIACSEISKSFQSLQTAERFQIKDNVAIDTRNGLMWTRCLIGTTWNGTGCEGKVILYGWQEIHDLVKTLNYAGYSDWRIPSLDELNALADYESTPPMIKILYLNQAVFPMSNCNGKNGGLHSDGHPCWHWTATPIAGSNHYAWIVYFGYGYGSANYEADTFALRLVRNN